MDRKKAVPSKTRIFFVTLLIKTVIRILAKVDARELSKIGPEGPMILSINHINFLEVPMIQTWLLPRKMRGFVKRETWDNRVMKYLFDTYRAIPVDRGGVNMGAFREVKKSLEHNYFICIAPEGTRSGNGVLQEGKPGITTMALMTRVPILPVVHFGGEGFWDNFKRFRRTLIKWKVGKPFCLENDGKTDSGVREEMTREIMYQMAALLPEELRGEYSDTSGMSTRYLRFIKQEG